MVLGARLFHVCILDIGRGKIAMPVIERALLGSGRTRRANTIPTVALAADRVCFQLL
jgi:hypothetical protein